MRKHGHIDLPPSSACHFAAGPLGIPQLLEWDLGAALAALDAERAATDQPFLSRGVASAALTRSASGQPPRKPKVTRQETQSRTRSPHAESRRIHELVCRSA